MPFCLRPVSQVDKAAPSGLEKMATSIGVNLLLKTDSWVLSTAAALYWRVKGNAAEVRRGRDGAFSTPVVV